jgi:hypothetical protein
MKKLLVIIVGLAFALGTVSFAQDKTDDQKTEKKGKKKKKDTDKTEDKK